MEELFKFELLFNRKDGTDHIKICGDINGVRYEYLTNIEEVVEYEDETGLKIEEVCEMLNRFVLKKIQMEIA